MKTFLDKLLEYYSLTKEDYFELSKEVTLGDVPEYTNLKNIDECANYLKKKAAANTKILIYGDYDCDGIMSTSIMVNTFSKLGYKVGFYIPFRETDGYGLNVERVEYFASLGYKLFVCVDNGIVQYEAIDKVNELGCECVVIDHHTPGETLPNAKYIIHPQVSEFGDINMSAGCVCSFVSRAMLGYFDKYLFTLGAVSLISDLMELKGYNRTIVKVGLEYLNENMFSNLVSLLDSPKAKIDEFDLSMNICPKINAVARLINDNKLFNIVRLFITDDPTLISSYSKWVKAVNEERKRLITEVSESINFVDDSKHVIFPILKMKEGLTGLVANKIMEKYNKPVFVCVKEANNPNIYKGSARSKDNFSVVEFLNDNSDLFLTFGGHKNAGGFSFNKENYAEVVKRADEYAINHPFVENKLDKYVEVNLNEINNENYDILMTFGPFGQGNPYPAFMIKGFMVDSFNYSADKRHIITKISMNSSICYFNYNSEILDYTKVNLIGKFNLNIFNGRKSVQFIVFDYEI